MDVSQVGGRALTQPTTAPSPAAMDEMPFFVLTSSLRSLLYKDTHLYDSVYLSDFLARLSSWARGPGTVPGM